MTMVKLTPLWHRTINILALFGLFIGVQVSRFGVTVIAVPAGVGLGIVFTSFVSLPLKWPIFMFVTFAYFFNLDYF